MARLGHVLSPCKSRTTPNRVLLVAVAGRVIEHGPGVKEHRFRCAAAGCYRWAREGLTSRDEAVFHTQEQWWAWFDAHASRRETTWVFGNNMRYVLTLLGLWDRLGRSGLEFVFGVLEPHVTILATRRGVRLVVWVDTQNYWRCSLEDLAASVGQTLAQGPHAADPKGDHADFALRKLRVMEGLICSMIQTMRAERLGSLRYTSASTAMQVWRTSYLHCPIYVHDNLEALRLERDALFGGLLTLSRYGFVGHTISVLDVNSLYPSIMRDCVLPYRLVYHRKFPPKEALHAALSRFWCVAEVSVAESPVPLPWRGAVVAGHSQAAGTYVVCGETLRRLADLGLVHSVARLSAYDAADLFSRFVADLYPRKVHARTHGDLAGELFWKMILNSLSGKFAQAQRGWKDDPEAFALDRFGEWWQSRGDSSVPVRYRSVAGRCQFLLTGGEPRNSSPIITAAICSEGRRRMHDLAHCLGHSEVLYMDTDGLHVSPRGRQRAASLGLLGGDTLGGLRVVCEGSDAYYWGPKFYRVGDYFVSNVIPPEACAISDGVWMLHAQCGLEASWRNDPKDSIFIHERTVHVATGNGAHRPAPRKIQAATDRRP